MKKRTLSIIFGVLTAVALTTGCGGASGSDDFEADEAIEEEVSMEQDGLTETGDVSMDTESEETVAE